jgi:hypothetical protein
MREGHIAPLAKAVTDGTIRGERTLHAVPNAGPPAGARRRSRGAGRALPFAMRLPFRQTAPCCGPRLTFESGSFQFLFLGVGVRSACPPCGEFSFPSLQLCGRRSFLTLPLGIVRSGLPRRAWCLAVPVFGADFGAASSCRRLDRDLRRISG